MSCRVGFVDFILDPAEPGVSGLSDLVWRVAGRLAQRGDDVHVVGPYGRTASLPDGPVLHSFALPPIGYRNILGHALIVLTAARVLSRIGPFDVIHVPEYLSSAILTWLFPRTPIVLTTPGNIFERIAHGNPFDWWTTQVYKVAAWITARRAAHVIAVSEAMRDWWIATGADPERVTVVPTGVEMPDFTPRQRSPRRADDPLRLTFVARISPENGLEDLLRALPLVRAAGVEPRLTVVGDGPDLARVRALAGDLGVADCVTWPGWVSYVALRNFYEATDVFVACHRSAGLPRVLQQAMTMGIPVLGTRIAGIVDHVSDGRNGRLVAPRDPDGMARAIVAMVREPAATEALGARAREYALEHFHWDRIVDRIRADIYAGVVGRWGTKHRGR